MSESVLTPSETATTLLRWVVYVVRCADGSLYTGITTDLDRRLHEHNHTPKGARYTRRRRPVCLAYHEHHETRAAASRREHAIKQLGRHQKESLITPFSVSAEK